MSNIAVTLPKLLNVQGFEAARPLLESLPFPALWIGEDYSLHWANAAARLRKPTGKCYECLHGYESPCESQANQPCRTLKAAARGETCEFVHVHRIGGGVELYKVIALPVDKGVLELHIPIDESFARDTLTGLLNRPAIEQLVRQNIHLMRRLKQQCALAILDLDRFKRINDHYGHAGGDAYLRAVGEILRRETRSTDLIGRWGGEEFLVFMPGSDRRGAATKVQRLLQSLRELYVAFHGEEIRTTASAGIWVGHPRSAFERIYEDADGALYQAKEEGRDRFCFACGSVPRSPVPHSGNDDLQRTYPLERHA